MCETGWGSPEFTRCDLLCVAAAYEKCTELYLPNHKETCGIAVSISRSRCYLSKKNDCSTHFANGEDSLRAGKCHGFSPLQHLFSNPAG